MTLLVERTTVHTYAFKRFQLRPSLRELTCDGEDVPLPVKAFDILVILIANRHRVVEKDELIRQVWSDAFVTDHNLSQNVWILRQALCDFSNQPQFILTVARHGYRFIAPVTESPSDEDEASGQLHATARLPLGLPLRFTEDAPAGTMLVSGGTLSPDGRQLVFVAQDTATRTARLWVRTLAGSGPRPLSGTDGAQQPFWSPDSRRIGFFADATIKAITLEDGSITTVTRAGVIPMGASWSPSGQILFSDAISGLYAISTAGGDARLVVGPEQSDSKSSYRWPQFLPDGQHFLYLRASSDSDDNCLYVGSLASTERVRLLDVSRSDTVAFNAETTFAPSGHLLWLRERALVAQRFNAKQRRLLGTPVTVVPNLAPSAAMQSHVLSAAPGLLAFGGGRRCRLVSFDRSGERLAEIDAPVALHAPMFSPDGTQLVAWSGGDRAALWLADLDRGTTTCLATGGYLPVWSPRGDSIAFSSSPGLGDICVRSVVDRGEYELLLRTPDSKCVTDWSRDGYICYVRMNPQTLRPELWLLPIAGDREPRPYLQPPFNVRQAQTSPAGHWMAYTSDETGRWEVYVDSFPVPAQKHAVSIGGGMQPQWRADGRELFYVGLDDRIMAVSVEPGEIWRAERPRALFQTELSRKGRNDYSVAPDGQRFVISMPGKSEPIAIFVNWTY